MSETLSSRTLVELDFKNIQKTVYRANPETRVAVGEFGNIEREVIGYALVPKYTRVKSRNLETFKEEVKRVGKNVVFLDEADVEKVREEKKELLERIEDVDERLTTLEKTVDLPTILARLEDLREALRDFEDKAGDLDV